VADSPELKKDCWIGTGTSIYEPYPCTCRYNPCRWDRCHDRTRTDNAHLPDHCCGSQTNQRRRAQGEAEAAAPPGWVRPQAARRPPRPAPAARPPRPAPLADDLWGPAPALEPVPVYWGAVDEPPPEPDDVSEGADPYRGTPEPTRQTPVAAEVLRATPVRAPAAGRAPDCDCRTPWDPPPPTLLIACSPKQDGKVRQRWELPARVPQGHRLLAEAILIGDSYMLAGEWEQKRHALMPGRPRMRPCWLAPITEETGGGVAVIDMPEPTGTGVHCADCHINLANASAFQVHKPDWRADCKPPEAIRVVRDTEVEPGRLTPSGVVRSRLVAVRYAGPLLVRGKDGVWAVDSQAPWSRHRPG